MMRIDALNQVSQLYQSNSTKKIQQTGNPNASDRVEISQMGKDYQIAKQAVGSAPDIREDRVAELKAAIASGTYNVSDEEIADKIIGNYFENLI